MTKGKHHIAAFTLSEVVVTMVVSSLVILMAYSVLSIVNGYFTRSQGQNELCTERLAMRTLLSNDIDRCDSLKQRNNHLWVYRQHDSIQWGGRGDTLTRVESGLSKSFLVGGHRLQELNVKQEQRGVIVSLAMGKEDSVSYTFTQRLDLQDLMNDKTWQSQ